MTRLLLRSLNSPALVLLALLGIAIQTSLFSFWPLSYVQPDIVLLLVIWCALRRQFFEGGVITLIVMASMTKADFGELIESRTQLITGVLVGVTISTIKLLSLFGLLSIPATARAQTGNASNLATSSNMSVP